MLIFFKSRFVHKILILISNFNSSRQLIRYMSASRTKLYVWGSDSHGQLGLISGEQVYKTPQLTSIEHNVKRIACGQKHIIFTNDEGECFSQGCNENGQLGIDNKEVEYSTIPLKVQLPEPVGRIFCGLSYSLALLENRQVYGWGLNEQGILGSSNLNVSWKPIKINIDKRHRIKTISCGALHCGFITEDGDVLMCGSNQYGQLGLNRKEKLSIPTQLDISFHAIDIACGVFYTLILDKQGKVYSFGNNKYGQLGTGTKQSQNFPRKIKALDNEYVVKVSAGYHSGALTNRGQLFVWGSGTFGEHLLPYRIQLEINNFYVQFSIGGFFGAAIDKFGKVYTWGNNSNGQLGQGTTKSVKNPTQIKDLKGIDRIFCGQNFVIALPKQYSHARSISETPRRIAFKNKEEHSPNVNQIRPKHSQSIQKAVSNFKRTVNQLQTKETKLAVEKEQLEQKLQELSGDYEKLVQKYQLIETIVSEKQRMIAIYQDQIRQSNIRLVESSSIVEKYNNLVQENNCFSKKISEQNKQIQQYEVHIESLANSIENYKRKFESLSQTSESLSRTNESLAEISQALKKQNENLKHSIDNLKASERSLKSQIKNQKHLELQKGVEEIIKTKDAQIQELIKRNQKLLNELEKANQKSSDISKLRQLLEAHKQTIEELQSTLLQKQDEINQIHLQQQHQKNLRKFTGFMCSPSQRSDSKARLSPIKIQFQNKANFLQSSGNKQSNTLNLTNIATNSNMKELRRTIRQLQNQIVMISSQLECKIESEMKLQRQIQEQMLVSAQLKEDIREMHGSLTLTQSQHTESKKLLNRYETIISLKEQEQLEGKSRLEKFEDQFKEKQVQFKNQISRFKQQTQNLKERISIIEDRQKQSMCIIRAQKRQIQDLKIIESDFDSRTSEYKKLLNEISDKNIEIQNLTQKLWQKEKQVRQYQQIINIEREQFFTKCDKIQKQISRVTEIKDKLYQNGNQLFLKNTELEGKIHKFQMEEGKMKCQLTKLDDKLTQTIQCLEESNLKVDTMSVQTLELKKELKTTIYNLNQIELAYNQSKLMLQNTTQQLIQTSSKYKQVNELYKSLTIVAQNKSQQISDLGMTIARKQKQIDTLNSTIQQISVFNKQYSSNQAIFVTKIRDLEKHVADLESYLEEQDVNGRDMIGKNKELDRKNRQLADMLNKAIEQQAIEYKHKIMYEVANNASIILENFSENNTSNKENEIQITGRQIREFGYQITNRSLPPKDYLKPKNESPRKKNNYVQETPEQKYNKLLSNKILENQKKISDSANKLCQLLDFKELDNEQKYSKINLKIESMDEQKQVLLSKLASYTQKLRHI